ncbi:hypothetical protein SESBI_14801 [Sesbania bispinosa]|nr:hypothetical protein SESBI_14801 [Sesbania bispinosa]
MKKVQDKIEATEQEMVKIQTEKEDLEIKSQEKDQMIEKMKENLSAEMKKVQDKIETMEEEMAKFRTEKEDLEMKGQEKDQIMEQMKEDLQQAQAEAESYKCLSRDYSNALMEAGQKENLLECQVKKLKTECDQLQYEIERLEPVEEEKYKWKVRVKYDHEKREEMMKSYEKMMDIVQTHATNLATRVCEANKEIDSNPGMKLPWKIFKLQNPGPPLESNQATREVSQTQPTAPLLMPYHFPPNYIPPQNNNPETNQTFGPQNTTSQQTIFINFQGESQRPHVTLASKEIHQFQNPATEDSQSKEKLQILEERLGVNAIGESSGNHLIKKFSNVKTPMKVIFEELCDFGGIKGLTETERSNDKEMKCGFHCSDEHSIEECDEFKQILQSMMDAHLIQISCESEGRKGTPSPAPCGIRPLTIRIPTPFPYKSTKAVPWKYDVQALARDAIINISGIGGITRSGRIYTPEKL